MATLRAIMQRLFAALVPALAAAVVACVSPGSAIAAPYTWSGVSGAIWDLSNTNWAGAPSNPWDGTNGPTNTATFNLTGSNSAVVSGVVTTNRLTFAPTTTGTFTLTGGTIALAGGTSAQILNLLSGGSAGSTAASTLTIASTITSTTNFFIGGFGTTILSGSNSLSGTVTIGSGTSGVTNPTVRIANSNALDGAAAVVLIAGGSNTSQGQTLSLGNGITIAGKSLSYGGSNRAALSVAAGSTAAWNGNITGNISVFADGNLTIGTGTETSFAGNIRGVGTGVVNSVMTGLSKTDPGTWIINSASNTFTSTPVVSSGVVSITSIANAGIASAIGSGTGITVGNSTSGTVSNWGYLRVTSSTGGSSNRPIAISGGAVGGSGGIDSAVPVGQLLTMSGSVTATGSTANFVLTGSGNGLYSGNIIGTGTTIVGFYKTGAGTWTLSGSNSYTGSTFVNGGVLAVGSTNALGTTGTVQFGGGTLQYGPNNPGDLSAKILGSGSAISIDTNGQNVTFGSSLAATNTGGLTKTGAGTLTLSASNAFGGTTTVNGGTLALGNAFGFGSGAANLSAAGGVLDLGGNTVSRSGTVSFTGGTVQNGTLTNDTVAFDGQSGTVTATLAGLAGLTKSGAGLLTLSASNAYGGTTTVSAGTLALAAANAFGFGSGAANLSAAGGVLDLGGNTVSRSGTVSFTGGTVQNGTLTNDTVAYSGQSGTVTATLTGLVGLTKSGAGLLTLSAANSYTGPTTISGGTLALSGAGALLSTGSVSLAAAGATLDISAVDGSGITLGSVTTATTGVVALGGKTLIVGDATSGTFAGTISGAGGGLTKTGAGTLALTGASSYTGATTVASGTVALSGGTNRLPTATTLAFTGGTAALNGMSQTVAGLTVSDATSAAVRGIGTSASTLTVSSAVTLGGGSGTSTLLVMPQMSGSTASGVTLAVTSGITVNAGGDLRFGLVGYNATGLGNSNAQANGTLNAATPVTLNTGGSFTLDRMVVMTGSTSSSTGISQNVGAFTMTGGRLFIDNAIATDRRLSINGNMTVTGGTMSITSINDMAIQLNATSTNTLNPASFDRNMGIALYGNASTLSAGVPLGRVFTRLSTVGVVTLTSSASGGNIGTLNINDGIASPGGTTVQLGSNLTLVAGNGGLDGLPQFTTYSFVPEADGRADVGIDANGYTLDLSGNSNRWQPNSAVSGTVATQAYWQLSSTSGSGRFVANGFNFVYTTSSTAGTLNAYTNVGPNVILESKAGSNVANNLGSGTISASSIFRYSGTAATATPSTLTAGTSIGDLEVAGTGALRVLSIAGTVGNVRVSNGSLVLGGTGALPTMPSLDVTGGTVDVAGYATAITDLTGSAGGTITSSSNTTTTLTVGGAISTRYDGAFANSAGTLNLVKTGAGTLTLGGANTFTGTTTISEGSLVLDNALALQNSTFDTAGSASLSFGSLTAASFGGLAGSGNIDLTALTGGLTVGGGNRSSTYGGVLSGAGGLTKTGTGTFILTGSQGYSGATTISQGTLQVGDGGTTGSLPAAAVTSNGVLAFNRSDSLTFSQAIAGSGSVTQSGGGRLTLSASNSYTGGTLITGTGSLSIASPNAVGSGTITLQTAQTGPSSVLILTSGTTLSNAINFVQAGSNRNNLETTGVTTLSGPMTISGTGNATNILSNVGGTLTTVAGNLTAASSFTGNVSFRGNILVTGTINMPGANMDINTGGTTTISSTGNVWTYTQFQASSNVLKVGAEDALPTNARIQFSGNSTGGGLDLNGFNQSIPGFTSDSGTPLARIFNNGASNSTLTLAGLTVNRSASVALADGTGGGTLALVMNSAGRTQTLSSATSSYTGGTTIVAGTIALGHGNGLGGGGPLAVNGGGLDLRGFSPTVGALSGSAGGRITSGSAGAATLTVSSASDSTFAGLIENGLGTVGLTKAGVGALTLSGSNTYSGLTNVNAGTLVVNGSLAGDVATLANAALGGSGSVGVISGAGLVGPGNSPGILTAPSIDPSGGLDFAFEFTQAAPDYASATVSDNDVLWLTGGTPFTSSLTSANTVSIYLTQSAAGLGTLTGGFFTANQGDFLASIQGATFQYFVQDALGTFTYNGQSYKTLSQYDASKSVSIATVSQNGGQVMQLVVVPEPGALLLAGVGVAAATWRLSRRRRVPSGT